MASICISLYVLYSRVSFHKNSSFFLTNFVSEMSYLDLFVPRLFIDSRFSFVMVFIFFKNRISIELLAESLILLKHVGVQYVNQRLGQGISYVIQSFFLEKECFQPKIGWES